MHRLFHPADGQGGRPGCGTGHHGAEIPLGQTYASYRVWDAQQSLANTASIYCNAAAGYIPLPVIEAQTVLQ